MVNEAKYPTRIAPYGLRMPPDLKQRVEESARVSGRSLNAEIVNALERSYPAPTPLDNFRHSIRQAFYEFYSAETERESLEAIGDLQMLVGQKLDEVIQGEVEKKLEERKKFAKEADEMGGVKDIDVPF